MQNTSVWVNCLFYFVMNFLKKPDISIEIELMSLAIVVTEMIAQYKKNSLVGEALM